MTKGKKKKKDVDFQKVKIRVGRKLKRDDNETKAQFKARKIVIKELKSHSLDPITALAHHSDHISTHGKLSLINNFNAALTPAVVDRLNQPTLDKLTKFINDSSDKVRQATYRCLKTWFNRLKQADRPLKEFAYSIKPYLDFAFTHIDRGIAEDSLKFIEYLVNTNEDKVFEPLMDVMLRRYDAGDIGSQELKCAQKLKQLYLKHMKRVQWDTELKNSQVDATPWSSLNNGLDLGSVIHRLHKDDDREVYLVVRAKPEHKITDFLLKIPDENIGTPETGDRLIEKHKKRFRSV